MFEVGEECALGSGCSAADRVLEAEILRVVDAECINSPAITSETGVAGLVIRPLWSLDHQCLRKVGLKSQQQGLGWHGGAIVCGANCFGLVGEPRPREVITGTPALKNALRTYIFKAGRFVGDIRRELWKYSRGKR